MDRKLFGLFSGRDIVFVIGLAIIAPTTLGAVTAFTNVAVQDPTTGNRAAVNRAGQISIYDALAAYSLDPKNLVKVFISNTSGTNSCSEGNQYVVPAGKALIITSAQIFVGVNPGSSTGELDLLLGCNGSLLTAGLSTLAGDTISHSFETGLAVPAGSTIDVRPFGAKGLVSFNGYLVPAAAVPALGTLEAKAQNVGQANGRLIPR